MEKVIEATIFVDKVGRIEDYAKLPIMKDGKVVGTVKGYTELPNSYMLVLVLQQDVRLELMNDKPNVISIK